MSESINNNVQEVPQFEDYKNLIWKLAHKYNRSSNVDIEDLFSVGSLEFVVSVQNWEKQEKNSVSFSTFLYSNLTFVMINELERATRQTRVQRENFVEFSDFMALTASESAPEKTTAFKDSLQHMSEDAKLVVKTIFESPEELKRLSRLSIGKFFKSQGWNSKKVERVFFEIRNALCE